MNKGDEVWFSHKPGEGVTFTLKGKAGGRMEGDERSSEDALEGVREMVDELEEETAAREGAAVPR